MLDDLGCSGTEASLFDCPNAGGINVNNCGHSEDVGITCQGSQNETITVQCMYKNVSCVC